jgi:hypothetical protein
MKLLTRSSASEYWAVDVRAPCDSPTWTTSTNRTGATLTATFCSVAQLVPPISMTMLIFMRKYRPLDVTSAELNSVYRLSSVASGLGLGCYHEVGKRTAPRPQAN